MGIRGNSSSLTNITIPSSVATIGYGAFYWCSSLTGVYFSGNAPSLGDSVFYGDNTAIVYYQSGSMGLGHNVWRLSDRAVVPGSTSSTLAYHHNADREPAVEQRRVYGEGHSQRQRRSIKCVVSSQRSLGAGLTSNSWTNWIIDVALVPGTNTVRAYAEDGTGNRSATNSVNFVYVGS